MTETLASHLQVLMKKDIEHFADGVRSTGQDPTDLRDRGLAGSRVRRVLSRSSDG